MTEEPFDLNRLHAGDPAAVERVYVRYEPYLRVVARRQFPRWLRAKYDSADVVQSVWAALLPRLREGHWRFAGVGQFRAFLAAAVRNRLTDRVRQHLGAAGRERPLAGIGDAALPGRAGGRPSEALHASDLWALMLALCPPEHHAVLQLRRQGLTLDAVAARTGLHEGSVRRILRDLGRRVAAAERAARP
jgi:RNA polymerase sigma-70 factor (ECF subfamily)